MAKTKAKRLTLTTRQTKTSIGKEKWREYYALRKAAKLLGKYPTKRLIFKDDIEDFRNRARSKLGKVYTIRYDHKGVRFRVEGSNLAAAIGAYKCTLRGRRDEKRIIKRMNGYTPEIYYSLDSTKLCPVRWAHTSPGQILELMELKQLAAIYKRKLPALMDNHVSVEVEFYSPLNPRDLAKAFKAADKGLIKYLCLKDDGSLNSKRHPSHTSHELVITADEIEIRGVITRAMDVLNNTGAYVNASCGLHVHIDCRIRNAGHVYNNLMAAQNILVRSQPKTRAEGQYCRISRGRRLTNSKIRARDRYLAINPTAYRKHNTIEVRVHAGTTSSLKINNWVELLTKIADAPRFEHRVSSARSLIKRAGISKDLAAYLQARIDRFYGGSQEDEHETAVVPPTAPAPGIPELFATVDEADEVVRAVSADDVNRLFATVNDADEVRRTVSSNNTLLQRLEAPRLEWRAYARPVNATAASIRQRNRDTYAADMARRRGVTLPPIEDITDQQIEALYISLPGCTCNQCDEVRRDTRARRDAARNARNRREADFWQARELPGPNGPPDAPIINYGPGSVWYQGYEFSEAFFDGSNSGESNNG